MKMILCRIGNVLFCLFLIVSALRVGAENVSVAPPEGTVAVLHISSLQQITDSLTGFMASALQTKIDLDVEDLIRSPFDLENLNGLDRQKPILAFFLEPKEGEEGSLIGFYPVSDEKAFLSQFGELKTVKEGIYDTGKVRLSFGNGYVAIAKKEEAELLSKWKEQGGDAAVLAAQENPVQSDVWAHVFFEKVAGDYKESILEFQKKWSLQAGSGMDSSGLMSLVDGIQSLDLGISADAQALKIHKLVHPRAGSTLADIAQTFQPLSAGAVKGLITSDAVATVLVNFQMQDWFFQLRKILFGLSPALDENDREIMNLLQQNTKDSLLIQYEIADDPDNPLQMIQAKGVVDSEKGQALLDKSMNYIQAESQENDSKTQFVLQGKNGDIEGSPITTFTLKPKESDDPEAEAPRNTNPFTGEQTMNSAVTNGVLLSSSGDVREAAARMKNPEPGLSWPSAQDEESLLAARIDLVQLLRGAQKTASKSEGINPLALFKIPNEVDMQGVTLNLKKAEQDLLGTLVIPAQDIRKLESIVTGQMK